MKKNEKQNNQGNHINHLNHSSDNGDMSEWKETELIKIGNVVSGGTPSTANPEYWDGDILFITPFDLSRNKSAFIENSERKISREGLANSSANLLPAGSVVISSRAPIGYIAISKKEFTTNQGCKSVVPNSDFDSLYLYYCFNFYVERIKKLGAGSTFAEISKGDLELVRFPHPKEKPEQLQIARILSTCDVVIENTQGAIAKYKAIKQGMLHDLFTRGMDLKTGKLRPKYEDAPELYKESKLGMVPKEWEVDSIENVSKRIWIGLVTTMTTHYVKNGIPLIRNNNIRDNYIEREDMIQLDKTFSENNAQRYVHEGDIVTVHTGDIGTSAIINKDLDPAHGFATINTTVNAKIINNALLCYYFNSIEFKNRIEMYATGDGRSNLNLYDFLYILIPFPKNIDEQKLIAERLNSLNQKLHTEQIYLNKLQQLKAGLMGDLLSGRKRVQVEEVVNNTNFNSIEFDAFKNQC